jgi:nitrate reductase NapAB chaperone NapD
MPVFGYLAIPVPGASDTLLTELSTLPHCEIIPAVNRDVIVLVTDTPDEQTEKDLQVKLKKLSALQSLSMTFGHNDEQQPE